MWLPPRVSAQLESERAAHYARVERLTDTLDTMEHFNRALREIDPYLQLVRAKLVIEAGTPLKPGYWHLVRHNPGAPPSITTIEGPDGEYVEPNSSIFEMLRKQDLQNPRAVRERRRFDEAARVAAEREEARERERVNAEVMERYLAGTRTQVSMVPGWSQNAAGRRGRR